jgi:hypothetical protein
VGLRPGHCISSHAGRLPPGLSRPFSAPPHSLCEPVFFSHRGYKMNKIDSALFALDSLLGDGHGRLCTTWLVQSAICPPAPLGPGVFLL